MLFLAASRAAQRNTLRDRTRRARWRLALVRVEAGDDGGAVGGQSLYFAWAEDVGLAFGGWVCLGCHGLNLHLHESTVGVARHSACELVHGLGVMSVTRWHKRSADEFLRIAFRLVSSSTWEGP